VARKAARFDKLASPVLWCASRSVPYLRRIQEPDFSRRSRVVVEQPIVISEPHASPTHLPPQHPILLDQVREHLPLPAIQPAGQMRSNMGSAETSIPSGELTSQLNSGVQNQFGRDVGHFAY
jgi:hypothetical protein